MLICVEGIDFSGKSTLTKLLLERLTAIGYSAQLISSHYDQPNSEHWRKLFLDRETPMDPDSELLLNLYAHSRACHTVIGPALAQGKIVVMDRYYGSMLAMQGKAVSEEHYQKALDMVEQVNLIKPDIFVQLVINKQEFTDRRRARSQQTPTDKFEERSWDTYHQVLQDDFCRVAFAVCSDSAVILNGGDSSDENITRIVDAIRFKEREKLDQIGFTF